MNVKYDVTGWKDVAQNAKTVYTSFSGYFIWALPQEGDQQK